MGEDGGGYEAPRVWERTGEVMKLQGYGRIWGGYEAPRVWEKTGEVMKLQGYGRRRGRL